MAPDSAGRPDADARRPRDRSPRPPGATGEDALDVPAYLDRIGLDADALLAADGRLVDPDRSTLERLQRAHVRSVPFENVAITGYPDGSDGADVSPPGVSLDLDALFEKVVRRRRGGYCFELNGLFHSLLDALGYDVDRVAARVLGDDGDDTPPANHHSNVVHLDRPHVVDVGMGTPQMRVQTPLDGEPTTDETGVQWRVVEADRVDADYRTEYRYPGDDEWNERYVFDVEPRELWYFAATNDYLQHSPDSTFTGDPFAVVATDGGYRKLSADALTEWTDGEKTERSVDAAEWADLLADEFGVDYRSQQP